MKPILIISTVLVLIFSSCTTSTPPAEITGEWKLTSYGDPASLISAAPEVETSIIFDENGDVNGTFGCNGFGGKYSVSGSNITFTEVMSTLMFCEGPGGEQEAVGFQVFNATTSYTLNGDTLTIRSADGVVVVVLTRK